MRILLALVIGVLLFFPGTEFIRWVGEATGYLPEMSIADAASFIIIVLLCLLLARQSRSGREAE